MSTACSSCWQTLRPQGMLLLGLPGVVPPTPTECPVHDNDRGNNRGEDSLRLVPEGLELPEEGVFQAVVG